MAIHTRNDVLTRLGALGARGVLVNTIPGSNSITVESLENDLGVQIPEQLAEFYQTFSYLQIEGDEFVPPRQLGDELERIRAIDRKIANRYISILDDGTGGCYLVRIARAGREHPADFGRVYYWTLEEPGEFEYVAESVWTFIIKFTDDRAAI